MHRTQTWVRGWEVGVWERESAHGQGRQLQSYRNNPQEKKKWLPYDRTVFLFLSYKIYFGSISDREENVTEAKPARLSKLCACVNVYLGKSTLSL